MKPKPEGLQNLLRECSDADEFFSSLPAYVQESIVDRGNNIKTERDLKNFAENLLRGDG